MTYRQTGPSTHNLLTTILSNIGGATRNVEQWMWPPRSHQLDTYRSLSFCLITIVALRQTPITRVLDAYTKQQRIEFVSDIKEPEQLKHPAIVDPILETDPLINQKSIRHLRRQIPVLHILKNLTIYSFQPQLWSPEVFRGSMTRTCLHMMALSLRKIFISNCVRLPLPWSTFKLPTTSPKGFS